MVRKPEAASVRIVHSTLAAETVFLYFLQTDSNTSVAFLQMYGRSHLALNKGAANHPIDNGK
jgi:hypothetical protein